MKVKLNIFGGLFGGLFIIGMLATGGLLDCLKFFGMIYLVIVCIGWAMGGSDKAKDNRKEGKSKPNIPPALAEKLAKRRAQETRR